MHIHTENNLISNEFRRFSYNIILLIKLHV